MKKCAIVPILLTVSHIAVIFSEQSVEIPTFGKKNAGLELIEVAFAQQQEEMATKAINEQLSAIIDSAEAMDAITKTSQVKVYFNNLIEQKTVSKEVILACVKEKIKVFEKLVAQQQGVAGASQTAKPTLNEVKLRLLHNIQTHLEEYGKPKKEPLKKLDASTPSAPAKSSKKGVEVHLCHGPCKITATVFRSTMNTMKLVVVLKEVRDFLNANKQEIVTLLLENYVKNQSDLDAAFKEAGIDNMILKRSDWSVATNGGWPTIGWMQKNNKRIVIFTDGKETDYMFSQGKNIVESMYGELEVEKATAEVGRSKSQRSEIRYLSLINFFPEFPIDVAKLKKVKPFAHDFRKINSEELKKLVNEIIYKGLSEDGKRILYQNADGTPHYPNFIALDFVNKGNPLKYVNELNALQENEFKKIQAQHVQKTSLEEKTAGEPVVAPEKAFATIKGGLKVIEK